MSASRRPPQGSHPANGVMESALYKDFLQRLATRRNLLTKQREIKSAPSGWIDEKNNGGRTIRECRLGGNTNALNANERWLRKFGDPLFPLLVAKDRPKAEHLLAELAKLGVNCTPWLSLLAASPSTAPASAAQTMLPGWGNGWAPPQPRRSRPELGPLLPLGAPKPQGKDRVILVELGWE